MIEAVHTPDEAPVELKADTIINALGSKKNIFDDAKLTVPFTYVGDCSGEKRLILHQRSEQDIMQPMSFK